MGPPGQGLGVPGPMGTAGSKGDTGPPGKRSLSFRVCIRELAIIEVDQQSSNWNPCEFCAMRIPPKTSQWWV